MSVRQATVADVIERCHRVARDAVRLRPGQPRIAAFDADGTLWKSDLAALLWDRLLEHRALHGRASAPLARAVRALGAEPARDPYADFATLRALQTAGFCPEPLMARVRLAGMAGLEEQVVVAHAAAALEACAELRGAPAAGSIGMIETLRGQGYRVIVASLAPRWVVETAARHFGIEPADIVAGEVAVVAGRLTDDVIEPFPHGPGRIQAILKRCGSVPKVAAGSALADLQMLEAASHVRLLVDPSADLLEACEAAGGTMWFMSREASDILPGTDPPAEHSPAGPRRRARRPGPRA